jgi:phosphatidylethanolamine-binding protein (PEBP) family uncharacterized protein
VSSVWPEKDPPGLGTWRRSEEEQAMTLSIISDAFEDGAEIPTNYTCEGDDIVNWR